jgi:hypothetical protein
VKLSMLACTLLVLGVLLAGCEKPVHDATTRDSEYALSDTLNASRMPAVADKCGGDFALAPGRAGAIVVGMPADSARSLCRILREWHVAEYSSAILVASVGSDSIRIWTGQGKVDWLDITVPHYKTADGIGVGSRVDALLRHGSLSGGFGDGLDVFVLHTTSGPLCGLSFQIDAATATAMLQFTRNRLDSSGIRRAFEAIGTSGRVVAVWVLAPRRCG